VLIEIVGHKVRVGPAPQHALCHFPQPCVWTALSGVQTKFRFTDGVVVIEIKRLDRVGADGTAIGHENLHLATAWQDGLILAHTSVLFLCCCLLLAEMLAHPSATS